MKSIGLHKQGQAFEKVYMEDLCVSLLASSDGTEIIHHKLAAGGHWALIPEQDWTALESIYILSGTLSLHFNNEQTMLTSGDFISAKPVLKHMLFIAESEVQFLYVTSQPVFHHYSKSIKHLMDLSISIEEKDGYTSKHCHSITSLSMAVGNELRLPSNQLYILNYGAFFHDIGKVKVPENILFKPSKLTKTEWKIMQQHSKSGAQILRNTNIPHLISAATIVEQHHERYNGSGYPYGLREDEICIEASIIGIVDSFDAMVSDRIYQKGRSKEYALQEIRNCRGMLYHPDAVDAFITIMDNAIMEGEIT